MKIKEVYKLIEEINRAIKVARRVNHYVRADFLTYKKNELKKKIQVERTKPYANQ